MRIDLPQSRPPGDGSLAQAISLRRTGREFGSGSISPPDLARLLWAASGHFRRVGGQHVALIIEQIA